MPTKLKQMREKVKKELEYIPDWPEPQGELRALYWMRRMHSLGKKAGREKTAKEVLEECIAEQKGDYPDFEFKYDEKFFNNSQAEGTPSNGYSFQ